MDERVILKLSSQKDEMRQCNTQMLYWFIKAYYKKADLDSFKLL